MAHLQDERIDQCIEDIKKYERWGNLLAGQCFVNLFNSNAEMMPHRLLASGITISFGDDRTTGQVQVIEPN